MEGGVGNEAVRSAAGFLWLVFLPCEIFLLIAPGCCLVPEAFLVIRWGSGPRGVVGLCFFSPFSRVICSGGCRESVPRLPQHNKILIE